MLYIVGLPIGNLEDITLRALRILKEVDVIACEDTRNTLKLLNHFEIKKKLISYHKFNEKKMLEPIIELLTAGNKVALVSDSGMPLISDPGNILVKSLKENGLPYTVIPGASASLSALVLSGFDSAKFSFVGFLPEKNKDRIALIESVQYLNQTLIFYISPHSLEKDIETITQVLGQRKACLVKEITKIYESVYDFLLGDEIEINQKGEFVLIVEGGTEQKPQETNLSVEEQVKEFVKQGFTENQAISKVAKANDTTKQELYKMLKVK